MGRKLHPPDKIDFVAAPDRTDVARLTMNDWIPDNLGEVGPLYLQIVGALEQDIAKGVLAGGARLLPHRDMAERLNLSVGTVARAYDEAERRGLISGEVGRGTFVLGEAPHDKATATSARKKPLNLALNAPPASGEASLIAETLAAIAADSNIDSLLPYLQHQGNERHRDIIAGWLSHQTVPATADGLFITHGAHADDGDAAGAPDPPGRHQPYCRSFIYSRRRRHGNRALPARS